MILASSFLAHKSSGVTRRAILIGAVSLLATGCIPKTTVYRLTLTFERNGKLYSGTGVRSYSFTDTSMTAPMTNAISTKAKGEAIPINFGAGRVVFVLLGPGWWNPNLTHRIGPRDVPNSNLAGLTQPRSVRPDYLPQMVTFDGPGPETLRAINTPESFMLGGSEVRLVSAVVEPASKPITYGRVEKLLPWFDSAPQYFTSELGSGGVQGIIKDYFIQS